MDIIFICDCVRQGNWSFTEHATRQMRLRQIDVDEVRQILLNGEIIEEYPDDKYSPSCLVYGQTVAQRTIHVVCSLPPVVRIVTVYEPDTQEWDDFRRRKK